MTLSMGASEGMASEKSFTSHYLDARERHGEYEPPNRKDFERAQDLFEQAFRGNINSALANGFASLGFIVTEKKTKNHRYVVIEEAADQRRGGGLYFIRTSLPYKKGLTLLTAPHTFHDQGSGRITRIMFLVTDAAGVGFNTVHRYTKKAMRNTADLSHVHISYFQAFMLAFAKVHPDGISAQIHGYDRANRVGKREKEAEFIVSAGTDLPSPTFMKVRDKLRALYGDAVLFYPFDTGELTALENTNGQALREMLFPGFVHIELSEIMRDKLKNDKDELKRLYGALSK